MHRLIVYASFQIIAEKEAALVKKKEAILHRQYENVRYVSGVFHLFAVKEPTCSIFQEGCFYTQFSAKHLKTLELSTQMQAKPSSPIVFEMIVKSIAFCTLSLTLQ